MIRAILFDKDGTLTDFRATWETWMAGMLTDLARASGAPEAALGAAIGFDARTGRIRADGIFVTAPGPVTNAAIARAAGWPVPRLTAWLAPRAARVAQVAVPGVPDLIARLRAAGFVLGVLSNADEAEARRHLAEIGILGDMAAVIGHDSGHGAKPAPGGAAAFARIAGLPPGEIALVGDGLTDMAAAAGAGLVPVAVLTGTLGRAALAPLAAAVLDDVRALPGWLGLDGGERRGGLTRS